MPTKGDQAWKVKSQIIAVERDIVNCSGDIGENKCTHYREFDVPIKKEKGIEVEKKKYCGLLDCFIETTDFGFDPRCPLQTNSVSFGDEDSKSENGDYENFIDEDCEIDNTKVDCAMTESQAIKFLK